MLYFITWLLIRALCLYVPYKMAFLLATIFQEYVCVLSHVWLFAPPWTVALQAPLSLEFFREKYWSGLPFPSPFQAYMEMLLARILICEKMQRVCSAILFQVKTHKYQVIVNITAVCILGVRACPWCFTSFLFIPEN